MIENFFRKEIKKGPKIKRVGLVILNGLITHLELSASTSIRFPSEVVEVNGINTEKKTLDVEKIL